MSTVITFREACNKGIIKEGDWINPNSIFSNSPKEVNFGPKKTGFKHGQKFSRKNIKWFYAKDCNGIDALWGSPTNTKLTLNGMIGSCNGVSILNKVSNVLYSDMNRGIIGRAVTEKDILFFKENPNIKLDLGDDTFWLASSHVYTFEGTLYMGLKSISSDEISYTALYSPNGFINTQHKSILTAIGIYFPSEVYVNTKLNQKDNTYELTYIK